MELLNINNYDKEIELRKEIDISRNSKQWKRDLQKEIYKNLIKTKREKQKPYNGMFVYSKKKKKKRKLRKRKIIRSYKTYMKSKLWQTRKNQYFQKYGKKCEACGCFGKSITLHHAIYNQNYGQEPDNEVYALCGKCHQLFHDNHKLKKDMLSETLNFIEEVKSARFMTVEIEKMEVINS